MVKKNIAIGVIIILVVVSILLGIFIPSKPFGMGASSNVSNQNPSNTSSKSIETTQTVQNVNETRKTVDRTSSESGSVEKTVTQTNTYSTDGIETYQKTLNEYEKYNNCGYVPPGYHRYQSNLCDRTQDELPITMPDPNEGIDPLNADPLWLSIQYGSLPCGKSNKLNYCQ